MKDFNKLFASIEQLNSEFVNRWVEVCNIESPTEFKAGVDSVGEYFAEYSKNQGWSVEIFEQEIAGNCVCITMNADSTKQPVTLSGHMDTVHPVGAFSNPTVKLDHQYICGPGVMDCKGGIVAALLAMTALKNVGFTERPVRLLLQSDEETNSTTSNKETINYMCQKAADSIAFLNCESIRGNTAVLWRKGICRYRFEISGQSIHASRCAEGGASAIAEAAYKVIELEKLKDMEGLTCNCGLINGGTSANTVPDMCTFVAEIRFNNLDEQKKGEKILEAVAQKSYISGTSSIMTKISSRPAMEKNSLNFELLEKLNKIYSECGLPVLSPRQSLGGSDAAEITCAGIACVDSIGVAGDKIHTIDEYAVVSSLSEAAKRIAAACYAL